MPDFHSGSERISAAALVRDMNNPDNYMSFVEGPVSSNTAKFDDFINSYGVYMCGI